jgi:hypothetical protein
MSFGLPRRLARELMAYPEADQAVNQYINMGRKFVTFPEKWEAEITKPKS